MLIKTPRLTDRELVETGPLAYMILECFDVEITTTEDPLHVRSTFGVVRISYHDESGDLQFRTTVPNSFWNRWNRQDECFAIVEKAMESNPLF